MKRIILLSMFLFSINATRAQDSSYTEETTTDYSYSDEEQVPEHEAREPQQLESTQNYQAEKIPVKKFDKEKWKKIIGPADFEEERKKEEVKQADDKDDNWMPSGPAWDSEGLRIFLWIIVIAFIIMIIYFIVRNFTFEKKLRKEIRPSVDPAANVDEIDDLDIDHLLQQAMKEGNLRMTIRLYYLRLLQTLQKKEVIVWKKDKTNKDYLTELFSKGFHFEEVRKLTLAYEQVWYGEYDLTPEIYGRLVTNFENTQQNINTPPSL